MININGTNYSPTKLVKRTAPKWVRNIGMIWLLLYIIFYYHPNLNYDGPTRDRPVPRHTINIDPIKIENKDFLVSDCLDDIIYTDDEYFVFKFHMTGKGPFTILTYYNNKVIDNERSDYTKQHKRFKICKMHNYDHIDIEVITGYNHATISKEIILRDKKFESTPITIIEANNDNNNNTTKNEEVDSLGEYKPID